MPCLPLPPIPLSSSPRDATVFTMLCISNYCYTEAEIIVVVAVASSSLPRQPPSTNETFIVVVLGIVVIVAVLRQVIYHLGIRNRN